MVKRGRAAANLSDAEQAIHNEEKRLAQNARARARNRRKKAGVPTVLPDRFIHYRHDPPVQSGTPVPTGPTGIRTDLAIPTDQEQNDAIENLPPPILEADPLVTDPSGLPFRPLPTVDVVVSRQSRAESMALDLLPPEVISICSDSRGGSIISRMSSPSSRLTDIYGSLESQASQGAALPALLSRDKSQVFDGLTPTIDIQTDSSGHHTKEDSPTSQSSDCYATADESVGASDHTLGPVGASDETLGPAHDVSPLPRDPQDTPMDDEVLASVELPLPSGMAEDQTASPSVTASRLGRQLLSFQGCSPEKHDRQSDNHYQHHSQAHVNPECSSLSDVTSLLGALPNMIGTNGIDTKPRKVAAAKLRAAFAGIVETPEQPANPVFSDSENSDGIFGRATEQSRPTTVHTRPLSVCMHQKHSPEPELEPEVSFDVDSVTGFVQSLAFAAKGMALMPIPHKVLNLTAPIHFSLPCTHARADRQPGQSRTKTTMVPLHRIPHVCLGQVIGLYDLSVMIFFPNLRPSATGPPSSFLTTDESIEWVERVLLPALNETVPTNAGQYWPSTYRTAEADTLARNKEALQTDRPSNRQIIKYFINPVYLDPLWRKMLGLISSSGRLQKFSEPRLFINSKNTKLHTMSDSLSSTISAWRQQWDDYTRAEHYSMDDVFVDLAKQMTMPPANRPNNSRTLSPGPEPQTFLWRKCCLESYYESCCRSHDDMVDEAKDEDFDPDEEDSEDNEEDNEEDDDPFEASEHARPHSDSSESEGAGPVHQDRIKDEMTNTNGRQRRQARKPLKTVYPFATLNDAQNMTLSTRETSRERADGLVYTQLYDIIKVPFSSAKVKVFNNDALENLALDPGYVRTLQLVGGAKTFSEKACRQSYEHSKLRARRHLMDDKWKSFGTREEHRVSLTLVGEILRVVAQQPAVAALAVPYFSIPTPVMMSFLRGQMNKYCYLFENTLAATGKVHSLPEFVIMCLALRSLRFCYQSSLISAEPLLWHDSKRNRSSQAQRQMREGAGLSTTMPAHGIGWWIDDKFDWEKQRVKPSHNSGMLAGNPHFHAEYQKRQSTVKDLRDVFDRLDQVRGWIADRDKFVNFSEAVVFEYLYGVNLEQFHIDVLTEAYREGGIENISLKQFMSFSLAWQDLKIAYREGSPHCITGNRTDPGRPRHPLFLARMLFGAEEINSQGGKISGKISQPAWANLPFRGIFDKTKKLILKELGAKKWRFWEDTFFHLVLATNFLLPWPGPNVLHARHKVSGGLARKTWMSSYMPHFRDKREAINDDLALHSPLNPWNLDGWPAFSLIQALNQVCIRPGRFEWGRRAKEQVPLFIEEEPYELAIVKLSRNKTLEELDELIATLFHEWADMERSATSRQSEIIMSNCEAYAKLVGNGDQEW